VVTVRPAAAGVPLRYINGRAVGAMGHGSVVSPTR
jgi:hypothetical protein